MILFTAEELFDGVQRKFNQAFIVSDSKIVWQGDKDSIEIKNYNIEKTINLKFAMPGLIDCHVHITKIDGQSPYGAIEHAKATIASIENLKELRSEGVVACRDLGCADSLSIGISKAQKEGYLQDFPTLISSGAAIAATGGHGTNISYFSDGPDEVTKNCRKLILEGADVIKVMMSGGVNSPGQEPGPPELEQEEINAAVIQAHARGRKVAVHAHGNTAIRRSVIAGVDSIEHGVFNSEDIIDMMLEKDITLVPTLSAPYYATIEGIRQEPDNPDHKKSKEIVDRHNKITLLAFNKGVKLCAGSDAGAPFDPYNKVSFELVLLNSIGIPVEDVLKIATYNGAELLGLNNLGQIKAGNEASFIALENSPFNDINEICNKKQVWIKGVKVEGGNYE
ncbi:MAG: amidohydrolase family protein [Christensenellaceae bacterium]|nr:amidohydrolase family protein [Christensenellaceae bacterium]